MKYFIVLGILFSIQLSAQQGDYRFLYVEEVAEPLRPGYAPGPFVKVAEGSTIKILILSDSVLTEVYDPGERPVIYHTRHDVFYNLDWESFAIRSNYTEGNDTSYIIRSDRMSAFSSLNYHACPYRFAISADGRRGEIFYHFSDGTEKLVCAGALTTVRVPVPSWPVPQEFTGGESLTMGGYFRTQSNYHRLIQATLPWGPLDFKSPGKHHRHHASDR